MEILEKEIDTKTIKGMFIEKLITAVCWVFCFIVVWQFSTAYRLDTKLDNLSEKTNTSFTKVNEDIKLDFTNSNNDSVKREADILKRVSALEESMKKAPDPIIPSLPMPTTGELPHQRQTTPPSNLPTLQMQVQQTPLEYERMYRKDFKKE